MPSQSELPPTPEQPKRKPKRRQLNIPPEVYAERDDLARKLYDGKSYEELNRVQQMKLIRRQTQAAEKAVKRELAARTDPYVEEPFHFGRFVGTEPHQQASEKPWRSKTVSNRIEKELREQKRKQEERRNKKS